MNSYFKIQDLGDSFFIYKNPLVHFPFTHFYVDHYYLGSIQGGSTFTIDKRLLPIESQMLTINAGYLDHGRLLCFTEQYYISPIEDKMEKVRNKDTTFKAGDILDACDNVHFVHGYIGHAAIVVDENSIVEAPGGAITVQKVPIQQFEEKHPMYAHFRPKSKESGEKAANYALQYLENYKENVKVGKNEPIFSYNLEVKLKDPSHAVYCSKLVWLSYYYGANYEFGNEYLWFSPEDLYHDLRKSDDFELIYIHPDYEFKINL